MIAISLLSTVFSGPLTLTLSPEAGERGPESTARRRHGQRRNLACLCLLAAVLSPDAGGGSVATRGEAASRGWGGLVYTDVPAFTGLENEKSGTGIAQRGCRKGVLTA